MAQPSSVAISTSQQAAVAIFSILLAPIPVSNESPTSSPEIPSLDLSQEIGTTTELLNTLVLKDIFIYIG